MDSNHHQPDSESGGLPVSRPGRESARKDSNLRPRGPKPRALTRLRYSPNMVAALATGTARAMPRKRDEASSESKHDDGSPRTSDADSDVALDQHHLLSVGDGSVSRTHATLRMSRRSRSSARQPLWPLSYPVVSAPTRSRTSRLRHRRPLLCPAELWTHDHEDGSPDRDRTCCLLGRNQVLYPDELRGHGLVGLDGVEPVDLPDVGGVLCR